MKPLHFSGLKWIAQSPAHFYHYLHNPQPQSKAMRMGSAVDRLVSSGAAPGVVAEAFKESTILAELKNKTEAALVLGMYAALRLHRDAWSLITEGKQQHCFQWDIAGRTCEGTPDVYTSTRLVDLKTTRSAHPDKFQRDARWRGYHAQLSWYRNGLIAAGLSVPNELALVTVENTPPHIVTVFAPVTERALEQGEMLWRGWFERLRVCEESNEWPGYTQARVPFEGSDDGSTTLTIGGEEVEVE